MEVSVVTTTFNEVERLPLLVKRIRRILDRVPHEIIVVDDGSTDGTYQVAKRIADKVVVTNRLGQTFCLWLGMKLAKYDKIITLDADLENNPKYIPVIIALLNKFDYVHVSRKQLPRVGEKLSSSTIGRILGVTDLFSNYRGVKKKLVEEINVSPGETFGAEILLRSWIKGAKIINVTVTPEPRRPDSRVGRSLKGEIRVLLATVRVLIKMVYLVFLRFFS
ncbi:MAG: hypothetical protein DRJ47_01070 [Thermoprotei archaeon]|nr:MAG: hypothetical protein DRJ47_01070 [Thermoprotei archaeon]